MSLQEDFQNEGRALHTKYELILRYTEAAIAAGYKGAEAVRCAEGVLGPVLDWFDVRADVIQKKYQALQAKENEAKENEAKAVEVAKGDAA